MRAIGSCPWTGQTAGEELYGEGLAPGLQSSVASLDPLHPVISPQLLRMEACHWRSVNDISLDPIAALLDWAMNQAPRAMVEVEENCITKCVPERLTMLESFRKGLNCVTPVCTAFVAIARAVPRNDCRRIGCTIGRLGWMSLRMLIKAVMEPGGSFPHLAGAV
jgi:hypothetical protein